MNRIGLSGKVVEAPTLKESEKGTKYCYVNLAVERPYCNENGEVITDIFTLKCFNTLAENAAKELTKDTKVIALGRLQSSSLTTKEGGKYFRTDLICDSIELI